MSPTLLLAFTIPGNPGDGAVNAVWRSIIVPRRGARAASVRVVISAKGKRFRERALVSIRHAAASGKRDFVAGGCSVVIRSYWGRERHLPGCTELPLGDVDATAKAVLDAMEAAGVYDDDSRVHTLTASKHLDREDPRIEVEVYTTH